MKQNIQQEFSVWYDLDLKLQGHRLITSDQIGYVRLFIKEIVHVAKLGTLEPS